MSLIFSSMRLRCFLFLLLLSLTSAQNATKTDEEALRKAVNAINKTVSLPLTPGQRVVVVLRVPKLRNRFADILLTLTVALSSMNVDIYCKPGTSLTTTVGASVADVTDYEWKSDHRHGRDFVFISRHQAAYEQYVITDDKTGITYASFACTLIEAGNTASQFQLTIESNYGDRSLVKEEQDALTDIFKSCCREDRRCDRWKQHMEIDNAFASDFCHFEGNFCDDEGHLVRLNLNEMNMSCPFPGAQLSRFKHLQKLQLRGNPFKGRVSTVLKELEKLQTLDLIEIRDADLKGELVDDGDDIDAPICRLARSDHMKHILLQSSGITGIVPACVFLQGSKLRGIDLTDNALTGKLPPLKSTTPSMMDIVLRHNSLTGSIPEDWTSFRNVQLMDLSTNLLTGKIPDGFGSMRQLQQLNLQRNLFDGSFPATLLTMPSLIAVNISDNRLTGKLPRSYEAAEKLRSLSVSRNRLTGNLPEALDRFPKIRVLELSQNQFSGLLPEALGKMNLLSQLSLDNNQLTGPLPVSFDRLTQLTTLHLHGNGFTGSIPHEWEGMTQLKFLTLNDNSLTGMIPGWMWHTTGLLVAKSFTTDVSSNRLIGFDESWYEASRRQPSARIIFLDASDNRMEGEFPPVLARQSTMLSLNLANNNLSGPLPDREGDLISVLHLNLSTNTFTGSIPENWSSINLFSSPLPTVMDLSNNDLGGEIPSFLFKDEDNDIDREFYLRGNNFQYRCPLTNAFDFVADLECNITTDASSVVTTRRGRRPAVPTDVLTNSTTSTPPRDSVTVSTQSSRSNMKISSSGSSATWIPILGTVAAVCFAIAVVLLALLIRSRKEKRNLESRTSIPMQPLEENTRRSHDDGAFFMKGHTSSVALV